ncbi:MAG: pilin [Candidatus Saccharimonadales bacterium]
MKRLLIFITTLSLLALGLPAVASAAHAPADAVWRVAATSPKDAVCEGVGLTGGSSQCDATSSSKSLNNTLRVVIGGISLVVGVIAVIMLFIGGLKYITSTGDPAKVSSAKDTILYAIIGLIVVAFAQLIVRFTLKTAETPTKAPTNQQQKS